jgi:pSer/pThr/pTyr-binding forkhead associated (FHA) protein
MGSDPDDPREVTNASTSRTDLLAQVERRPSILELVRGQETTQRFVLSDERILVGREEGAEIQLASREVSRRHLLVTRQGSEFSILDLDSRNGVYLNGIKVHSATLRDGDTLQIGELVFVFHQGH